MMIISCSLGHCPDRQAGRPSIKYFLYLGKSNPFDFRKLSFGLLLTTRIKKARYSRSSISMARPTSTEVGYLLKLDSRRRNITLLCRRNTRKMTSILSPTQSIMYITKSIMKDSIITITTAQNNHNSKRLHQELKYSTPTVHKDTTFSNK